MLQAALLLVAASCGAAPSQPGAQAASAERPFTVAPGRHFRRAVGDGLPARKRPAADQQGFGHRKGRALVARGRRDRPQAADKRRSDRPSRGAGRSWRCRRANGSLGAYRVYLSYVEPGPNGTSGAAIGYGRLLFTGPAVPGGPTGVSLDGFKVIWRQQPKVSGDGHFAHRIAFAPDGTMFVTSGDRQKMQPAQDRSSDLGKVIHMTAEGQRIGGRFHSMGHRNLLGIAFAPDGRLWATEMGPQGRRRAQRHRPGQELRLAARVLRQPLWRRRHPRRACQPRVRGAQGLVEPGDLAGRAADLHRRRLPAVEGRCADPGAVRPGACCASTSTATARARPTSGTWASASAPSTRGRTGPSICSRTGRAGGCSGSIRARGGSANNKAGALRGGTWRRSGSRSSRRTARGNRPAIARSTRTAPRGAA